MRILTLKYFIIAHTKESIDGIPPEKHRRNTETNISRLITRMHAIQHKTDENKMESEARRILNYNTNRKIEPPAQIHEALLDWHPKL